jgi:hypothetical protein
MIEQELMDFAYDFLDHMQWDKPEIIRIKINKMVRCKGWCIPDTNTDGFYILLSELTNTDNKDFFATLIHELIHAVLANNEKTVKTSHLHGRKFKRMAKQVEKETNGFYTIKDIV